MEHKLTPLSLAGILDESFDLYKRNFGLFVGIAAIVEAPSAIALTLTMNSIGPPPSGNSNEDVSKALGVVFIMLLALCGYALVWILQSGAQVIAASSRYLNKPITIGQAYKRSLAFAPRLLGGWFILFALMMVIGIGFMFVAAFVMVGLGVGGQPDPAVLGVIMVVVVAFVMIASLLIMAKWGACLNQTIMVEGVGATGGLARSGKLVEGNVRRSFWLLLTVGAMIYAVGLSVATSLSMVLTGLVYPHIGAPAIATKLTEDLLQQLVMIFMMPFYMSALTVHYFDLRIRKEGFDIAVRAGDMSKPAPPSVMEGLQLGQGL